MDAETRVETALALVTVGLFLVAVLLVGATYDAGGLTESGGLALVGVLAGFVVAMSLAGYWLSGWRETEE